MTKNGMDFINVVPLAKIEYSTRDKIHYTFDSSRIYYTYIIITIMTTKEQSILLPHTLDIAN